MKVWWQQKRKKKQKNLKIWFLEVRVSLELKNIWTVSFCNRFFNCRKIRVCENSYQSWTGRVIYCWFPTLIVSAFQWGCSGHTHSHPVRPSGVHTEVCIRTLATVQSGWTEKRLDRQAWSKVQGQRYCWYLTLGWGFSMWRPFYLNTVTILYEWHLEGQHM